MAEKIKLYVSNTVTYIADRLPSDIYQELRKLLGYRPETAIFKIRYTNKHWDGIESTLHFNEKSCKCSIKKKGTHFPTGLFNRARDFLVSKGLDVEIYDIREKVEKNIELKMSDDFEMRDYQTKIIQDAVSMQRGIIKSSTGSGKCINKNSFCLSEDGLLSFNEIIKENDLMFDKDGYSPIIKQVVTPIAEEGIDKTSHLYNNGISNTLWIKTRSGFEIEGTHNHKIRILSKETNNIEWKELKDLKIGDYVVFIKGTNVFGNNLVVSEDDAYWMGLLTGDGCLTEKKRIRLHTQDDHIISFAKKYLESRKIKYSIYRDKRRKKLVSINLFSESHKDELTSFGCKTAYSYEKEIPLMVRKSPKKIVASFIRGLFETDGFCSFNPGRVTISIGLSSKILIDQLHLLLLNYGILSHRRVKKTSRRDSYILSFYNDNVKLFLDLIGLDKNGYKYRMALKGLSGLSLIKNSNVDIIPCMSDYIFSLYKELKKNNKYKDVEMSLLKFGLKKFTIRSWSGERAWRRPSRKNIKIFINWAKYLYSQMKEREIDTEFGLIRRIVCTLEIISSDMYHYEEVAEIKKSVSETCDFVVPKSNSFIAQGMINHNTGMAAGIIQGAGVSPFIFYVPSIDLLQQAQQEFSKFLRYSNSSLEVGIIGNGKFDIKDINVMTVQTAVRALGGKYIKFDDEDEDKLLKVDVDIVEQKKKDILDLIQTAKGFMADECIDGEAELITDKGSVKIKNVEKRKCKKVLSYNGSGVVWCDITKFMKKGYKEVIEIELLSGKKIICTKNHPIMTQENWKKAGTLRLGKKILVCADVDVKYDTIISIKKCEQKNVYDITVEDTHCFFANGILVHNCQHWAAETAQIIADNSVSARYRYGMSATPMRDKGDDILIDACFGRQICNVTASFLIEHPKKYLVRPDIYLLPFDLGMPKSDLFSYSEYYKYALVENPERNKYIASIAKAFDDQNRITLILCQHVSHGKILEQMIDGSLFIYGEHSGKERKEHLQKMRDGNAKITIATSLPYSEKILIKNNNDIKMLDIGFICEDEGIIEDIKNKNTYVLSSMDGKTCLWKRIIGVHRHKKENNVVRVVTDKNEEIYVTENHSLINNNLEEVLPEVGKNVSVPQVILEKNTNTIDNIDLVDLFSKINDKSIEIGVNGITQGKIRKLKTIYRFLKNNRSVCKSSRSWIKRYQDINNPLFYTALGQFFKYVKYYKFRYRCKLKDVVNCRELFSFFDCYIFIRSRKNFTLPISLEITESLAIISGLMCSEGHIKHENSPKSKSQYSFIFSALVGNVVDGVNDKDKRNIRNIFKDNFYKCFGKTIPLIENNEQIRFNSKLVYYLFSELGHLDNIGEKQVPHYIFNSSIEIQEAFLWGFYLGDGSKKIDKKNRCSAIGFHTSSRSMACSLSYLMKILGISFYSSIVPHTKNKTRYNLFAVNNFHTIKLDRSRGLGKLKNIKENRIQKIVSIANKKYQNKFVYDISVEDTRNFVSGFGGVLCHNSIFDEGIDCRPLDTLILAGGGKSVTRALQRVGRVLRPYTYPSGKVKDGAIVVDIQDNCKYLLAHAKKRKKIYQTEPAFNIKTIKA